jgi:RNA polymerase sigma factor (TIGR02999 family)
MSDVTQILSKMEHGDAAASEQLLPLVYDELRKLAAARLAAEKPGQTLQATALVHEAYIRLVDQNQAQRWNSRGHFFAAAAEAMRRIVDTARKKLCQKRGGDHQKVDIDPLELVTNTAPDELLAIDDALDSLAKGDPQAAELVKLRYYAGFSVAEAAEMLGISRSNAYVHWDYARAWLRREIAGEASE